MVDERRVLVYDRGQGSIAPVDVRPASNVSASTHETALRRALIVDDNPVACRMLAYMLRATCETTIATGIEQALDLALGRESLQDAPLPEPNGETAAARFDLVLLDIDLGERRTGVELLHLLREHPAYARVPFIACTGYTLPGLRARFLEAGFDAYLAKPFAQEQLLSTLAHLQDRPDEPEAMPHRLHEGGADEDLPLNLPPLPTMIPALLELMAREESIPDTDRLKDLLRQDPVTATWVLQHINTAYFGLRQRVTTIDRAVVLLGFNPVCNLVLAHLLARPALAIDTPLVRRVYDHLMAHALATAAFARHLTQALNLPQPECAFTAGLFVQLGRLALLSTAGDSYARLWCTDPGGQEQASSLPVIGPPPVGLELMALGRDYLSLGARLAACWALPLPLQLVIRHHRTPRSQVYSPHYRLVLTVSVGFGAAMHLLGQRTPELQVGATPVMQKGLLQALAEASGVSVATLKQVLHEGDQTVQDFVDQALGVPLLL